MKGFWGAAVAAVILLGACGGGPQGAGETEAETSAELATGVWRTVLKSPGGALPFRLEIAREGDGYRATAHNGAETLPFDRVSVNAEGAVVLALDHYESAFRAQLSESGKRMDGTWTKTTGPDKQAELEFFADHGQTHRFALDGDAPPAELGGRWAVTFANQGGEPEPAIAEFEQRGAHLQGTFLTPTGDYRFLEGGVEGDMLFLSCFDGGHAFLFKASLQPDGSLKGDFWSRDSWHDTWTAVPDPDAALPDPFAMSKIVNDSGAFRFSFPNLDGETIDQDHASLAGKVRLISVFGSWCPNCNDEAPFLQALYEEYRDRGFEAVGIAFELTEDVERSRRVLRRFQKRHGLDYPILLAGGSNDKAKAAEALPDLDRVIAYPTAILIDRQGKAVWVHTGFEGPGTGDNFETLQKKYRAAIEALL